MPRVKLAFVAALVALAAFGAARAQEPGADPAGELLKKVAQTYKHMKSYHFESTAIVETKSARLESKMNIPLVLAAVKADNRVRFEAKSLTMDVALVSDGKTRWSYLPALNQYTKEPMEPDEAAGVEAQARQLAVMIGVRPPAYEDVTERVKSAKLVREEAFEARGKRADCYVIEVAYEPDPRTPNNEMSPKTLWVDKAKYVVYKEEYVLKIKPNPLRGILESRQTTTFEVASVNEPLPEALFAFAAPEKAELVDDLPLPGREPRGLAGKMAKDFTLPGLDGKAVSLKDLRGKVVLLNFWASWCGPCRIEMPHLEKLHREYKDKGLVILGINDEEAGTARGFLKSKGFTFPTLSDDKQEVGAMYGVESIPTVFVINKEGKIVVHHVGARSEKELREAVKKAGL